MRNIFLWCVISSIVTILRAPRAPLLPTSFQMVPVLAHAISLADIIFFRKCEFLGALKTSVTFRVTSLEQSRVITPNTI